jgi:hypothetical protein
MSFLNEVCMCAFLSAMQQDQAHSDLITHP